jgi:hypothetical protein
MCAILISLIRFGERVGCRIYDGQVFITEENLDNMIERFAAGKAAVLNMPGAVNQDPSNKLCEYILMHY